MKHNDGGPAFPDPGRGQSAKQRDLIGNPGMSLRDYFAAKAMQGLLSKHGAYEEDARARSLCSKIESRSREDSLPANEVAAYSYCIADAMIIARADP
ncbi:MAG: hypothetical protein GX086_07150 [Alcaligenaceae bacterium]|nr:hypothetical protein [Alcaligenaceae bacterium]